MPAFAALSSTLGQLADAIRPLTVDEYTRRDGKASGSIGAHVRHCLDHVCALELALTSGDVCYDRRERNTVVEHEPRLGASRLQRAMKRLGDVGDYLLDRPLMLSVQIDDGGRSIRAATSVGRELAFVVSHTIHHNALVAVLLERMQRELPGRFGLAPTTPDLPPEGGSHTGKVEGGSHIHVETPCAQ